MLRLALVLAVCQAAWSIDLLSLDNALDKTVLSPDTSLLSSVESPVELAAAEPTLELGDDLTRVARQARGGMRGMGGGMRGGGGRWGGMRGGGRWGGGRWGGYYGRRGRYYGQPGYYRYRTPWWWYRRNYPRYYYADADQYAVVDDDDDDDTRRK